MECKIIWFTGLSGSGKTTLAKLISKKLKKRKYKVKEIDGDVFRKKKKIRKSFTKKKKIKNNYEIINLIKKIREKYDYLIVSVISPLLLTRRHAKKIFENNYYEVYTKCKISTLRKRDTKGLYQLADSGKLKNLIGYKSKIKYERSKYSKIVIDTDKMSIKKSIYKILNNTRN